MLNAAINHINAGDTAEAKELLTTIKKDFAASSAQREVDKYLAAIE
jgi:hypothetical protein